MFAEPSDNESRRETNRVADILRMRGPFEPHRLPIEQMEYTTLGRVMKKLEARWEILAEQG